MGDFDPKLLEALKLVLERPDVLQAALKLAQADVVQKPGKTVGQLWDEWAPWGKQNIPSWRICVNNHSALRRTVFVKEDGSKTTMLDLPWQQCTPQTAGAYRAAREVMKNGRGGTVSPVTVNRELATLQAMLKWHVEIRKSISHNPINGFHRADEESYARKTSLSPEQVRQFIEHGTPLFQDVCWVAYRCAGMRHTEARCLRKSEVDLEQMVINLPASRNKNRRARTIPIPDDAGDIIKRHMANSRGPYVFTNPRDPKRVTPVSAGSMQQWLTDARERSGMVGFDGENIVIHSLRHAGVTELVTVGAQESSIKAAAGMSEKTFRRYNKWTPRQQQALREHMNRMTMPPVPITEAIEDERKPAKARPKLTLAKTSGEDVG